MLLYEVKYLDNTMVSVNVDVLEILRFALNDTLCELVYRPFNYFLVMVCYSKYLSRRTSIISGVTPIHSVR